MTLLHWIKPGHGVVHCADGHVILPDVGDVIAWEDAVREMSNGLSQEPPTIAQASEAFLAAGAVRVELGNHVAFRFPEVFGSAAESATSETEPKRRSVKAQKTVLNPPTAVPEHTA